MAQRDCYFCPFITDCPDRKYAKQPIDQAANVAKMLVRTWSLMPTYKDKRIKALSSVAIHRSVKSRNLFLKHLHHDIDVWAGVYIWNHPKQLNFIETKKLGENVSNSSHTNPKKLAQKRKRGVTGYNTYKFLFKSKSFTVKTECSIHGFEQFYALYESKDEPTPHSPCKIFIF